MTTTERIQALFDDVRDMANITNFDAETFKRLGVLHGNIICNAPSLLDRFHEQLDDIWTTDEFIEEFGNDCIDMVFARKTRQYLRSEMDSPYCIFTNMQAYQDFKEILFNYTGAGIKLFKWISSQIPPTAFLPTDLYEACLHHIIMTNDAEYFTVFEETSFLFVYANIRELMARAIGTVVASYADVSIDALLHIVTITQMLYHVYPLRHTTEGLRYSDVIGAMFHLQYKKKLLKEKGEYEKCIGEIAFRSTFDLIKRSYNQTSSLMRDDLMRRFFFPRFTEHVLNLSFDDLTHCEVGSDPAVLMDHYLTRGFPKKRIKTELHTPKQQKVEPKTPDTIIA